MMEFKPYTLLVRDSGTVSVTINNEVLLMHVDSGCYFTLLGTGPRIWELLERPSQPDGIVDAIQSEFEVDEVTGREETLAYLSELLEAGLVHPVD